MKTGEGKTLTATMPVYLNALTGRVGLGCYRQRLSGQTGRRMDGHDLSLAGNDRRQHPP